MARITRAAPHLSVEEVKTRVQQASRPLYRQRWLIIYNALVDPREASEIAKHTGTTPAMVHRVIVSYNREGVSALETTGKGGRRRESMSLQEEEALLVPFLDRAEHGEIGTVFLHSGSRGIGNKIAAHHIKIAQKLCERFEHRDLAYLIEDTPEFDQYIQDLHWAQHFALFNREEMLDRVVKDLGHFMKADVKVTERVNTHHNYTRKEHHMGRDLWITRKGAISAQKGQLGLIPGSMGTGSFVVIGKGNKPSFCSAPHGAGRKYSRTEARKQFTVEDMKKVMKGIEYREEEVLLDEMPGAYKPIETVMDDAKELVDIVHKFTQLINVKGD